MSMDLDSKLGRLFKYLKRDIEVAVMIGDTKDLQKRLNDLLEEYQESLRSILKLNEKDQGL